MPKIVVSLLTTKPANQEYDANPRTTSVTFWKQRNGEILDVWFAANQDKFTLIADQLTKKLGKDKFKNMILSNPRITWDELTIPEGTILTPKVTFNLTPKEGYEKASDSSEKVTLTIRNLYKDSNPEVNVFQTQGSSPSTEPAGSTPSNNAAVIIDINVYMNYTGPSIVLDEALPTVGGKENTSINGTSNVTGAFNNAFRGNPTKGLLFTNRYPNPLLQSVINYVNKFDPKFRAAFVTEKNGVALTSVQSGTQLKIGSLNDFLYNNKGFLQQVHGDSTAVYFAVNGVTSQGWLNTFLIRIPLTKFVKPLTEFRPTTPTSPSSDTQQQVTEQTSGNQDASGSASESGIASQPQQAAS
ncbi:hemagglutinin [Mycoplasmopsis synoviae]|uniref:hemagglutinin n=1 Tax=Mycoplasmopsis synoviae TaxID=2109 RepID=UPI001CE0889F|nr:hemagglutinin [Mycoplasmopsis synoviae]UBX97235.1 hemagglutinin [Mycoplasmopsis synoviae]